MIEQHEPRVDLVSPFPLVKYARRDGLEGKPIPPGYGVAWQELNSFTTIMMPIPFNWICGWVRKLFHQMKYGSGPCCCSHCGHEALIQKALRRRPIV